MTDSNIHRGLTIALETVHGLIVILLVYGLLFCPNPNIVFLCLFLSILIIFIGQVSHQCLMNHLQYTWTLSPETAASQNRFDMVSKAIGNCTAMEPTAVYLVLLVTMHFVVLVGFFRLYTMLSREKGFL
jgi:hypothetical protein